MDLSHNVSHTFTMINLLQVWPLKVSLYAAHLFPIGVTLHHSFVEEHPEAVEGKIHGIKPLAHLFNLLTFCMCIV